MTTDIFKQVLFNDGEGLAFGDLHDVQRFQNARIADQFFRAHAGIQFIGSLASTADRQDYEQDYVIDSTQAEEQCFALRGGAGYVHGIPSAKGGVALEVYTRRGTILQRVATADGASSGFLAFEVPTTLPGSPLTTLGAGDAVNPRIDAIDVQLQVVEGDSETRDFEDAVTRALTTASTDKTRRVDATFTVTAGTPAPSPSPPAVPANHVRFALVDVPALFNSQFDHTNFRDMRFPLGVRTLRVMSNNMLRQDLGQQWTIGGSQQVISSPGVNADLVRVFPPVGGAAMRLLGVGLFSFNFSALIVERLMRYTIAKATGVASTTSLHTVTSLTDDGWKQTTPGGGSAATLPLNTPIWMNGWEAGPARMLGQTAEDSGVGEDYDSVVLELDTDTGGASIQVAEFYVAGWL